MDAQRTEVEQALDRLYRRHNFGIKLGLEMAEAIAQELGHPERAFAAIHVAGTNGKGSVCAMVDSVLRAAGFRVGLYTSPHLIRFNERIRVNGETVTDDELAELLAVVEPATARAEAALGREATFFEITTAMAFEHFRRRGVTLVVLETGLGGRLDATNIVTPLLSVITPISLEHTQHLGPDIASIAGEKAGIIKPGRPVVCGEQPDDAAVVFGRTARERGCRLTAASERVAVRRVVQTIEGQRVRIESADVDYGTVDLALLGRHQLGNAALAVAALEEAAALLGPPLAPDAVRRGLEEARWPGRCQLLGWETPTILDGAHNPAGGRVLAETLKDLMKGRPLGLVVGMCSDKDARSFLGNFGKVRRCWTVPLRTERGVPPADLAALARSAGIGQVEVAASLGEALDQSLAWAKAEAGALCVAGSLYLVGEVLELRGESAT